MSELVYEAVERVRQVLDSRLKLTNTNRREYHKGHRVTVETSLADVLDKVRTEEIDDLVYAYYYTKIFKALHDMQTAKTPYEALNLALVGTSKTDACHCTIKSTETLLSSDNLPQGGSCYYVGKVNDRDTIVSINTAPPGDELDSASEIIIRPYDVSRLNFDFSLIMPGTSVWIDTDPDEEDTYGVLVNFSY